MEDRDIAELHRAIGRIEARQEAESRKTDDIQMYVRDVSRRVRSLEVSRGWFVGAGAAAGGVGAAAFKLIFG